MYKIGCCKVLPQEIFCKSFPNWNISHKEEERSCSDNPFAINILLNPSCSSSLLPNALKKMFRRSTVSTNAFKMSLCP